VLYQREGSAVSANSLRSWMQRAQARAGLPVTSGCAHPAAHVLLASRDARRGGQSDSGAGRTRRPDHHDALDASFTGIAATGDSAARAASGSPRGRDKETSGRVIGPRSRLERSALTSFHCRNCASLAIAGNVPGPFASVGGRVQFRTADRQFNGNALNITYCLSSNPGRTGRRELSCPIFG